jgi:hypothetical protein
MGENAKYCYSSTHGDVFRGKWGIQRFKGNEGKIPHIRMYIYDVSGTLILLVWASHHVECITPRLTCRMQPAECRKLRPVNEGAKALALRVTTDFSPISEMRFTYSKITERSRWGKSKFVHGDLVMRSDSATAWPVYCHSACILPHKKYLLYITLLISPLSFPQKK